MKAKDIYVPRKVPRIEVREKLHGHTQIMLRDVRTGKVERIEHDNTFTDGIDDVLRTFGAFGNSVYNWTNGTSQYLWETLLGGIMLFDTALPTSPMAKYMPAGTKMTANGRYGLANASAPTELGSYNSVESTAGANSFSLVYDWGTSQGNGTIASVALATKTGGGIGYGNESGTALSTLYALDEAQTGNIISFNTSDTDYLYCDNTLYQPESATYGINTTKVKVYKRYVAVDEADIFSVPLAYFTTAQDYVEFTLTTPLSGDYVVKKAGASYDTCLALVPRGVPSGNQFVIYILNVADGTVTEKTMTNQIGEAIKTDAIYIVGADKILMQGTSGKGYLVTMSTSAVVGEAFGTPATIGILTSITDELYVCSGHSNKIYDPSTNKFLLTNGELFAGGYVKPSYTENDALFLRNYRNGYWGSYKMIHNPLRLMTINNLQSAVTKDASKTMKVTYTVTRSS